MSGRSAREGAARAGGFTLIEMLSVIAILTILMALAIYGIGRYRQRAYVEGTRGLLDTIESALKSYYAEFREYPPDGFDPQKPVTRPAGAGGGQVRIRGSQCLIWFLAHAVLKEEEIGQEVRRRSVGPFLELKENQISGSGDLEARLADPNAEIVDAWGNPIHYDNVELDLQTRRAAVQDQSGPEVHTMTGFVAKIMHGPDPRRGAGGASGSGIETRNAGAYDLWSHGPVVEDPADDIANWKD